MDLTKKMYVPDPRKWIDYYKNVSSGHINSQLTYGRKNQTGGALMGSTKQFMIPIGNNNHVVSQQNDLPKLQLVSPFEQVVQQAKEELNKGVKRNSNKNITISTQKRQRRNTSKFRKSKNTKTIGNKKSSSKKKRHQKKLKKTGKHKKPQQIISKLSRKTKPNQKRKRLSKKKRIGSFNDIFA